VKSVRVAVMGDYNEKYISHPQTGGAVVAAGRRLGIDAAYEWIGTSVLAEGVGVLNTFDGYWMAPGGPYQSLDGALAGIRHVRLGGKPFVGT
jgi:CTP synthase (UTP-ammonia lyase)